MFYKKSVLIILFSVGFSFSLYAMDIDNEIGDKIEEQYSVEINELNDKVSKKCSDAVNYFKESIVNRFINQENNQLPTDLLEFKDAEMDFEKTLSASQVPAEHKVVVYMYSDGTIIAKIENFEKNQEYHQAIHSVTFKEKEISSNLKKIAFWWHASTIAANTAICVIIAGTCYSCYYLYKKYWKKTGNHISSKPVIMHVKK